MIKRELVKEEVAELAHSVVWREFSDRCSNTDCDYLTYVLDGILMLAIEKYIEDEHARLDRLAKEAKREREVQVYG